MANLDKKLYEIAKKHVTGISENADRKDLKQMWSDDWDFFDIAVWELESALKEAYELGTASVKEGKQMAKGIFKTLKNYSHGFHLRNDKTTNKIYDAKVKEIKDKILSNVSNAKERIAFEIKMAEFAQKTAYLGGEEKMKKCNAEWKAADNIKSALIDSKFI